MILVYKYVYVFVKRKNNFESQKMSTSYFNFGFFFLIISFMHVFAKRVSGISRLLSSDEIVVYVLYWNIILLF